MQFAFAALPRHQYPNQRNSETPPVQLANENGINRKKQRRKSSNLRPKLPQRKELFIKTKKLAPLNLPAYSKTLNRGASTVKNTNFYTMNLGSTHDTVESPLPSTMSKTRTSLQKDGFPSEPIRKRHKRRNSDCGFIIRSSKGYREIYHISCETENDPSGGRRNIKTADSKNFTIKERRPIIMNRKTRSRTTYNGEIKNNVSKLQKDELLKSLNIELIDQIDLTSANDNSSSYTFKEEESEKALNDLDEIDVQAQPVDKLGNTRKVGSCKRPHFQLASGKRKLSIHISRRPDSKGSHTDQINTPGLDSKASSNCTDILRENVELVELSSFEFNDESHRTKFSSLIKGKEIGRGSYGIVYTSLDPNTGKIFAIKQMIMDGSNKGILHSSFGKD